MQIRTCKTCKKEFNFRAYPSDIKSNRGKSCSQACARRIYPISFICKTCKKKFPSRHGRQNKFCSKRCTYVSRIGSVAWNRGVSPTKETREKQSLAKINYFKSHVPWNKKYFTQEEKEENEKKIQSRYFKKYNQRPENKVKHKARCFLNKALTKGRIKKKPCENCNNTKSEAHHHKGYARKNWLNVIWLCRKHHKEIHNSHSP